MAGIITAVLARASAAWVFQLIGKYTICREKADKSRNEDHGLATSFCHCQSTATKITVK